MGLPPLTFQLSYIYTFWAAGIAFLMVRLLLKPVRLLFKILAHVLSGCIWLVLVNWIGFSMPYTLPTILISGVFGIPGVLMLLLLRFPL